jgi:60 kDa SS-A/Ro ribonucleoprotein
MVRNLGNMASCSLLTPLSNASQTIISRLADEALIKKSRIHPMQLLLANGVFSQGHGNKGSNTWTVVQPVVDALEAAFYLAFVNVVPTGKKLYIGLDISGSMRSDFTPGSGISSAKAGAAMCLVAARTEQNYAIFGFSCGSSGSWTGGTHMIDLGFTAKDTLTSALDKTSRHNFGATDCSMPFQHAEKTNLDVDAFLTITDNETWNGSVQPVQALAKYRAIRNKSDVRSIVMAMTATEFTIADPNDPYSLDIVGFDTNVPALITDFIRGESAGNAVSADDL